MTRHRLRYTTCATVGESTPAAMRRVLMAALKRSEYAEARLDYISTAEGVSRLLDSLPRDVLGKRIVCTVRAPRDGGRFRGAEGKRHDALRMVAAYRPYLLDVELDALQKDRSLADDLRACGARILASWHNFDAMPNAGILRKKLHSMARYATHLKIACMAQNVSESIRMLEMYGELAATEKGRHCKLISFAMGDAGQMTRILCMHMGSPYTYVSLGRPLAPGQISLADVKRMERSYDAAMTTTAAARRA